MKTLTFTIDIPTSTVKERMLVGEIIILII